MSDTIFMLRIEHGHAASVLGALADEVASYDARESWDLSLIRDAVEYFCGYPAQCHHPVEDAVFRSLKKRGEQIGLRVGNLEAEHSRLAELTASLHALASADESDIGSRKLAATLKTFVETYTTHMQMEESQFFPAALRYLTEDDWTALNYDLFDGPKPLFDRAKESAFAALRERIVARGKRDRHERDVESEVAWLESITSIDDVNQAAKNKAQPVTVREGMDGRFELLRSNEVVAVIPACDQRQAAWLAHFYMKGLTQR